MAGKAKQKILAKTARFGSRKLDVGSDTRHPVPVPESLTGLLWSLLQSLSWIL